MSYSSNNHNYKFFLSWDRTFTNYIKKEDGMENHNVEPLDSDHLRILSSSSFRRLQDKTQLFPLEKNDYARTRLTHSCEVAATARSISNCAVKIMKSRDNPYLYRDTFIRLPDISYLSSLLHDIGNPPFGHYGEEIIRDYFIKNWEELEYLYNGKTKKLKDLFPVKDKEYWDFCGFDGNAQALRVISKLERYGDDPCGLNLTMSVMSGIIKYPFDSKSAFDVLGKNKFGYFQSELDVIDRLRGYNLFIDNNRSAIPYIVEAADDISMAISDFEDGVKKGCITYRDIEKYDGSSAQEVIDFKERFKKHYFENAESQNEEPMIATSIRMLNALRNDLVRDAASSFVKMISTWNVPYPIAFDDPVLPKPLIEDSSKYPIVKMLGDIVKDKVYQDEQIVAPELKGQLILSTLLEKMLKAVLNLSVSDIASPKAKLEYNKISKLISKNYIDGFIKEINLSRSFDNKEKTEVYLKLRLVVDQLSGMTDSYAEQVYRKIS